MIRECDPLERLRRLAQTSQKRILFPESSDLRVIEAIGALARDQLCRPVVLGDARDLPDQCEVFEDLPDRDEWIEKACHQILATQRNKSLSHAEAKDALKDPVFLAAALVKAGYADAGIAGSETTTASVLRAGIKAIGLSPQSSLVSSSLLMCLPNVAYTFADCAVNVRPNAEQLAQIAIDSASTHAALTGEQPRIGLISFSTHGSARHPEVDVVREALDLVRQRRAELIIDGELQFDAAFSPSIASKKATGSSVAGQCNVFIFPNLAAGNIACKIAERMGGAKSLGPIIQGLDRPWFDLSRGCSSSDVIETSLIAATLS